jgi:hypothetical protein
MSPVTPVGLDDGRRRLLRRTVVSSLVIAGLATAALLVALLIFSEQTALVLKVYFAALGLLLSLRLIGSVTTYVYGDGGPPAVERAQRSRGRPPNWPSDLFELEDRVSLARVSAFDYQSRLRPHFRDLAAERLAARRNVDLLGQPEEARRRLGDDLWDEIREVPNTEDQRDRPGPSIARLGDVIDRLESI